VWIDTREISQGSDNGRGDYLLGPIQTLIQFGNDVSHISIPHPHICPYFSTSIYKITNQYITLLYHLNHQTTATMATNILPNLNSLKFQTSDLLYFTTIALFILTMSVVGWITGLATFPIFLETSIISLVAAAIVILCRVVWENNYALEELERQMSSETYIEDRLEWLKEAAESLFRRARVD